MPLNWLPIPQAASSQLGEEEDTDIESPWFTIQLLVIQRLETDSLRARVTGTLDSALKKKGTYSGPAQTP